MADLWRRIAVVGPVCSGKTTLSRQLANLLQIKHVELDDLRYTTNWGVVPLTDFRKSLVEQVAADTWVIDGNSEPVLDLIWIRADTVVWLDYTLSTVLWQFISRTTTRLWKGDVFSGNRESLSRLFGRNSMLFWLFKSHRQLRLRYTELIAAPRYAHLNVVRLKSPAETRRWYAVLSQQVEYHQSGLPPPSSPADARPEGY